MKKKNVKKKKKGYKEVARGMRKEKEDHGGKTTRDFKRPQDQILTMEIAFDIGAGVMLAMGTDTCKSKGERVSTRSEPTRWR